MHVDRAEGLSLGCHRNTDTELLGMRTRPGEQSDASALKGDPAGSRVLGSQGRLQNSSVCEVLRAVFVMACLE